MSNEYIVVTRKVSKWAKEHTNLFSVCICIIMTIFSLTVFFFDEICSFIENSDEE